MCGSSGFRTSLFAAVATLSVMASAPCAGAIENKPFVAPITSTPPAGTQVNVDADQMTFDPNTQIGTASGKVHLTYGPYTLTATHVT